MADKLPLALSADPEEIQFEQIICVKQTAARSCLSGGGNQSNDNDSGGEKEPHFRRFVASKIVLH